MMDLFQAIKIAMDGRVAKELPIPSFPKSNLTGFILNCGEKEIHCGVTYSGHTDWSPHAPTDMAPFMDYLKTTNEVILNSDWFRVYRINYIRAMRRIRKDFPLYGSIANQLRPMETRKGFVGIHYDEKTRSLDFVIDPRVITLGFACECILGNITPTEACYLNYLQFVLMHEMSHTLYAGTTFKVEGRQHLVVNILQDAFINKFLQKLFYDTYDWYFRSDNNVFSRGIINARLKKEYQNCTIGELTKVLGRLTGYTRDADIPRNMEVKSVDITFAEPDTERAFSDDDQFSSMFAYYDYFIKAIRQYLDLEPASEQEEEKQDEEPKPKQMVKVFGSSKDQEADESGDDEAGSEESSEEGGESSEDGDEEESGEKDPGSSSEEDSVSASEDGDEATDDGASFDEGEELQEVGLSGEGDADVADTDVSGMPMSLDIQGLDEDAIKEILTQAVQSVGGNKAGSGEGKIFRDAGVLNLQLAEVAQWKRQVNALLARTLSVDAKYDYNTPSARVEGELGRDIDAQVMKEVVLMVDNSGSMGVPEFEESMNHIFTFFKLAKLFNAKIHLCLWSSDREDFGYKSFTYSPKVMEEIRAFAKTVRQGGTDLAGAWEYMLEYVRQADAYIVFTDGEICGYRPSPKVENFLKRQSSRICYFITKNGRIKRIVETLDKGATSRYVKQIQK